MPELTKLDRTKSTMRYLPPKGTAGLARSRVRGYRRVPLPPARTRPSTRSCMDGADLTAFAAAMEARRWSLPLISCPRLAMRMLRAVLCILVALGVLAPGVGAETRPLVFGVLNQQSPALTAERWN